MSFDAQRAMLRGPDVFERLRVGEPALALGEAKLSAGTPILIFERGGERRALLRAQMAYHHVAQGRLADEPYVISF